MKKFFASMMLIFVMMITASAQAGGFSPCMMSAQAAWRGCTNSGNYTAQACLDFYMADSADCFPTPSDGAWYFGEGGWYTLFD